MWKNDRGVGAIAVQIVGHPDDRADDFTVKAPVVHKLRRRNPIRIEAGECGIRELPGRIASDVIDPQIGWALRTLMQDHQSLSRRRERTRHSFKARNTGRKIYSGGPHGGTIHEIEIGPSILVDQICESVAFRREATWLGVPLKIGDPCQLARDNVQ